MTYDPPSSPSSNLIYTPTPANYRPSRLSSTSTASAFTSSPPLPPLSPSLTSCLPPLAPTKNHGPWPHFSSNVEPVTHFEDAPTPTPCTHAIPKFHSSSLEILLIPSDPSNYASYLIQLIQTSSLSLTRHQVESILSILFPHHSSFSSSSFARPSDLTTATKTKFSQPNPPSTPLPAPTLSSSSSSNLNVSTPDLTKVTLFPVTSCPSITDSPHASFCLTPRALNFKSLRQIHKEKELTSSSRKKQHSPASPRLASSHSSSSSSSSSSPTSTHITLPRLMSPLSTDDPLDRLLLEVSATKANEQNKPKRKLKLNNGIFLDSTNSSSKPT